MKLCVSETRGQAELFICIQSLHTTIGGQSGGDHGGGVLPLRGNDVNAAKHRAEIFAAALERTLGTELSLPIALLAGRLTLDLSDQMEIEALQLEARAQPERVQLLTSILIQAIKAGAKVLHRGLESTLRTGSRCLFKQRKRA